MFAPPFSRRLAVPPKSMKTNILSSTTIVGAFLLFCARLCQGQTTPAAANAPAFSDYSIVQRGPHSEVWRNSAGQTVTSIGTGMNFWNGEAWTPSDPSFEVSPDGTAFVAANIQDPTRLAANLDTVGAVTVTTPDNVTLRSTPIAIGLFDAASGTIGHRGDSDQHAGGAGGPAARGV